MENLRVTGDDESDIDFAEQKLLPLFEAKFPGDNRPRRAIEVARRFACGEATVEELREAVDAAAAAVYDAIVACDAVSWKAAYDAALAITNVAAAYDKPAAGETDGKRE